MNTGSSSLPDSKPHYAILDGLRGVAAVMVIIFHLFEAHARDAQFHTDQIINHGYLSVDFFFMLSGFVIGYAYDDRWDKMGIGSFFRRRLIRLQPMVVLGMLLGFAWFFFQSSGLYSNLADTPFWKLLLVTGLGCLLLPVPLSLDVRGWREMYPLNGPGWSLFFEYAANILYATVIRRFSTRWLSAVVALSACALVWQCVSMGNNIGGWSLTPDQLMVGSIRLFFPFFGGLLLYRVAKPGRIKNAFLWCSLMIVGALSMPHVGGAEYFRLNGVYDAFCIIILFPLIVFMGASGEVKGKYASRICKFLGDISYPLYITHYPLTYVYMGWVFDNEVPLPRALPMAAGLVAANIAVAWLCLKLYDEPVRRWLVRHLGNKQAEI